MKKIIAFLFLLPVFSYGNDVGICTLSELLVCGPNTKIEHLGTIENKYRVYLYEYTFGEAKRTSNRVVITSMYTELEAVYAVPELPISLQNNCIVFPFNESDGDSICVVNGRLPNEVLIDGEFTTKTK